MVFLPVVLMGAYHCIENTVAKTLEYILTLGGNITVTVYSYSYITTVHATVM